MDGHLPPPPEVPVVGEALVAELLEGESPPHEHPRLAVLGEDDVLGPQRGRVPHVNGLLAAVGHVERDPALALGVLEDLVHLADADHLPVRPEQGVVGPDVGVLVLGAPEQFGGEEVRGEVGVLQHQHGPELGQGALGRDDRGRVRAGDPSAW